MLCPHTPLTLVVVIVNYKTPELTINCLQSLEPEITQLTKTHVIVVDNDSGDGSAEKIQTVIATHQWESWVSFLPSDKNGGYAYGNNLAIRPLLESSHPPDYFLLLNPDTIVRPNAIQKLVSFMNEHPQVGIAGSRLEDPDGTPQRSAFRFPTVWSEIESGIRLGFVTKLLAQWAIAPPVSEHQEATDWVAGASMIVRRQVFEQVGLMDENYFLYYEEVDFCLQAKRADWSCWYVPESHVVHLVGQSSGVTDLKKPAKRLPQYWFDSRKRFFIKNYGRIYAALADLLWLIGFALWRIRRVIQQKPDTDPPYLLNDLVRHSFLPQMDNSVKISSLRNLWEQIKEDWHAHGQDWTKPGFRAVAVHRFGVWRMTVEPKILRAPLSIIYRNLYRFVRNIYGIDLPYTVQLGRRVIIEHQSGIIIHGYSVIGDDCIIRQGVTLGNRYLDKPFDAPKLGARVNIGAGAKILGGVAIADDVNIGANAVVLSDIPPGKTAVGIPAKILTSK